MNRTPPIEVRRQLRREVGFGCPVDDCGSPYLYWHHFDPPWYEREHHEPEGMIALCAEHHAKADAGAYTREQLREFKEAGRDHASEVRGRFDWMRHAVLLVVGGNFFYDMPIAIQWGPNPVVWVNRDEDGYLLLNVRMLTVGQGAERMWMEDNFWLGIGEPDDLECPPSGRKLSVSYSGGDLLSIEFFELDDSELAKRYPDARPEGSGLELPVTAAEIQMRVGGTQVEFGPRYTMLPDLSRIRNCWFMGRGSGTGIQIGDPY